MRLKWILASLSALLLLPVLFLAVVLTYLHTADLAKHRDFIAGHVSTILGRDLSLDGELDLNLSMTPSIVISDITLANASWASAQDMLTIQRVEAQIQLKPLLSGDLYVPRFHVRGVKTLLETSAEGQGNWEFVAAGEKGVEYEADDSPAEFKLPWLGDVDISDAELTYHDGQTGQRINASLDHALISSTSLASPLVLDISGQVNNNPVEINGQLVLPAKLATESFDIPVELHAAVLDLKLDASGKVSGSAIAPAIEFKLQANAANLNQMRQLFGDVVPDVQPVKLLMDVQGEQGQPVTMSLNANAGKAVLDTRLMLRRDGPRPKLSGKLDIRDVDVVRLWAPLLADKPEQETAAQAQSKQTSPTYQLDKPIDFRWLESFDADVVIAVDRIKLPHLAVNSLRSHVSVDDRKLVIDETRADTGAGSVTTSLQLNARGLKPDIVLDLNTASIVLSKLPPLAENERLAGGSARGAVSLTAQGDTVSALFESVKGNVQFDYDNKKLKEKLSINLKRAGDKVSSKRPLVVAAEGLIDGHAVELAGDVIPPAGFLNGDKPYRVNLAVDALGISGKITGKIADPLGLDGIDLGIKAQAVNLDGLKRVLGQNVPDIGRTELATQLTFTQPKLRLSKLLLKFANSRIEGWMALDTSASIPDLRTELTISDLNIDKLMPADDKAAVAEPPKEAADDKMFSDAPLPFDTLSKVNFQATLHANNLVHANRRVKQGTINIKLENGRLDASLLELSSVRGELLGDFVIDASGKKKPTVNIKLKAARIDLGELLITPEGTAAIEGPLATDIVLQGQGNSVAQIMATLNGHVNLLLEEGSADAQALDLFVGGLSAMLGTIFTEQSSKTRIICAICDLKFNDGLMTSELAVLDTQYSTVFVDGQVNLKNEQLDLTVSPEAKGVTLSVAFPVLVKGKLAEPNIDVEKKGALIKTGELWATVAYPPTALLKFDDLTGGKPNPCVSMVTEKGGIPLVEDVGKVVKGTVKGTGKVVEGAVEGTEKVVKGVGGVLKDTGSGLGKIFDRIGDDADADAGSNAQEEEEDDFDMDF